MINSDFDENNEALLHKPGFMTIDRKLPDMTGLQLVGKEMNVVGKKKFTRFFSFFC